MVKDPNSNPAKIYCFLSKFVEKMKMNQKSGTVYAQVSKYKLNQNSRSFYQQRAVKVYAYSLD